jgi:epoxyqueuosine reductase
MSWMAKNVEIRNDPGLLLPGCKSIIVIAVNYYNSQLHLRFPNFPRISRYAWGRDYHKVVSGILRKIQKEVDNLAREKGIDDAKYRMAVDSMPFRDKVWAQIAGIGWIGKKSMLLTREFGSWVFIGSLLTTVEFDNYSESKIENHCGKCTKCLDACPTGALIESGKLDSRACISYLTIEHKGHLLPRYIESLGGWIFGCDTCQDVCPWNRFAKPSRHNDFMPREGLLVPDLQMLSHMTETEYDELSRGTSLRRAGRERLRRNALAVMGLLH